jgi:hypothetical protein
MLFIVLRRITVISLAALVLLTSTGFSISAHLCGGKRVSYALFGRPDGCGMEDEGQQMERSCVHPFAYSSCSVQPRKCCSEQTVIVPGLQHLVKLTQQGMSLQDFALPAASMDFLPRKVVFSSSVKPRFIDYHPPPRARDLVVLLQVFRN